MRLKKIRSISILVLLAIGLWIPCAFGDIEAYRDIQYYDGPDAVWEYHILDIYRPEGEGPNPVLIFIHGGGWFSGDKDQFVYADFCEMLAERGIVCVTVNYRLSPAVMYPEHPRDVARAVAWTREHVAEYGGDPEHMVIAGHSAGAQLSAIIALNPEFLQEQGLSPDVLCGAISMSGPYDMVRAMTLKKFGAGYFKRKFLMVFGDDPEVWKNASPLQHVSPHHIPVLLVVGTGDFITPPAWSREFRDALNEMREDPTAVTDLVVAPGVGHFGLLVLLSYGNNRYADSIEQFIRKHEPESQ